MGVHSDGLEDVFDDLWVMEEGGPEVKFEAVSLEDLVPSTDAS